MTQHSDKELRVFQIPKLFAQWNLNCRFMSKAQQGSLDLLCISDICKINAKFQRQVGRLLFKTNGQGVKEILTTVLKEATDWVSVCGEALSSVKALRTLRHF